MTDTEKKPKLLVVEDDPVNNKFIVGLLTLYFVIRIEDTAANAAQTLKDGTFKPDFILSDYLVPNIEEFNKLLEVIIELNFPVQSVFITSSHYEAIRDANNHLSQNNAPTQLSESNFIKKPTNIAMLVRRFQTLATTWASAQTNQS
jgi:response regulator RpfG family c-di-GMP phosphodiesterase